MPLASSALVGRFFTTVPPGKAQEYWSGLPSPSPGDLPDPGIEPACPESLALQADSLPNKLSGKPQLNVYLSK